MLPQITAVFLSYTILSRHDGVLGPSVTDKAVVPKLLTAGVSKYLFYPKTPKESSPSPLEKQDTEYELVVDLNKAEQLSSHRRAIKQHCGGRGAMPCLAAHTQTGLSCGKTLH